MIERFAYTRVGSVAEAAAALSEDGARLHAGGTDLLGCLRDQVFTVGRVVSLSGVAELQGLHRLVDGGLRLGALTSLAELAASELVREHYPVLAQAAAAVGSPQLRAQGTVGGNLCQQPRCWYFRGGFDCLRRGGGSCLAVLGDSRYHAVFGGGPCRIVHPSDVAPALIALGAQARVEGPDGARLVAVGELFAPPSERLDRCVRLADAEVLTEVFLPPPVDGQRSAYRKVRVRRAWDFALASMAVALSLDGGRVAAIRVVFGGVAPIPWRSEPTEQAALGRQLDQETARASVAAATQGATPLDDNAYKLDILGGLVEEQLLALGAS